MIPFTPVSFQYDQCANAPAVSAYQVSATSVPGTQFCYDGINCSTSAVSIRM